MKSADFNSKWDKLQTAKSKNGYKALRINSTCKSDLFLALDHEGNRSLLLYLSKGTKVTCELMQKSKLALEYIQSKNLLLIRLKDPKFVDLFDDLINSIYLKLASVSEPVFSSELFVATFNRWSDFFEDKKHKRMNESTIQGLFGELFLLLDFVKSATLDNINAVLDSWKGLYGANNDFEFEHKNIEVKTKRIGKSRVNISSEFQLQEEASKGLELYVATVKIDLKGGSSIHDLLLEIKDLIVSKNGDLTILYNALNQKRLTIESLKQYDNFRFRVTKTESFDVTKDHFPRLVNSNMFDEVSNLKYELNVNDLTHYLLETKNYQK